MRILGKSAPRGAAAALALTLAGVALSGSRAQADLTLTPAAIAAGYGLTTFATDFPNVSSGVPNVSNVGPLGIAFTNSGGVLVSDYPGNVRLFPTDADGQSAASAPVGQNYGFNNALGLATVGSNIYLASGTNNQIFRLNPNGTFNSVVLGGLSNPLGLTTNPVNGHLFLTNSGAGQVLDVNPVTGTFSVLVGGLRDLDGISIAPDGSVVYVVVGGTGLLQGFNTSTGSLVFSTPAPFVDGTALGTGSLAGTIFANTINGNLIQVNLTSGIQTLIATGGSRGDFVAVAPNSTLLVTQTDKILRLTAPSGGGFGGGGGVVPEPGTLALAAAGLLPLVGVVTRRRKAKPAPV